MLTGILAGLAAGALWGLVFVAPRMAAGFASVDLTAGRFVAYGAMAVGMLLWGMRPGERPQVPWPTARQAGAALGLSVLGFTGYYLLLVLAIRDAGVEVPALIIGTIPVWVMLLGKPKGLRWAALLPGLALTLAGLALMAFAPHGEGSAVAIGGGSGGGVYWRGIGIALVALVFWTAFAILNSAWVQRHPEVGATQWANWLGVATGLGGLLLWVAGGTPVAELAAQPGFGAFVLVCLAIGVGASWLATILWNVASQRLSASLCGQLIVSETLFALFYSFAWAGHWPAPAQWAACVMFTLGILATIQAHR